MTYTDIFSTITQQLEQAFPGYLITGEDPSQGTQRPALFVEVIPLKITQGRYFKTKSLKVSIGYYSQNQTQGEYLLMAEALQDLFGQSLRTGGRQLTIDNLDFIIKEGVLQVGMQLVFQEGTALLELKNSKGQAQYMLPDQERGYTQESIALPENLEY